MTTPNPFAQFDAWFAEANANPNIVEPTAMTLATATADGVPSARIVLLKEVSEGGFVFYSNAQSQKGQELAANSHAALCFYWGPLQRQVRVQGSVQNVSDAEADAYFHSRPHDSQVGAWASQQSRPLDARSTLEARVAEYGAQYDGKEVPRPSYWQGWRIMPQRIEFWTERPFRLHDRELYTRAADGAWNVQRLYP